MNFKIARDGWGIIGKFFALLLFFIALLVFNEPLIIFFIVVASVLFLFSLYFFRDPERETPEGDDLVISPADGKIIKIEEVYDDHYRNKQSKVISVFMNVFSVHVNRFPISGTVEYTKYHKGKFMAAWDEKASTDNEHSIIGIKGKYDRKVTFKQIAGLVARRIVYNCEVGDIAEKGDRFGLIKFGSRLDIIVPLETEIKVAIGDKVSAGETILAEMK